MLFVFSRSVGHMANITIYIHSSLPYSPRPCFNSVVHGCSQDHFLLCRLLSCPCHTPHTILMGCLGANNHAMAACYISCNINVKGPLMSYLWRLRMTICQVLTTFRKCKEGYYPNNIASWALLPTTCTVHDRSHWPWSCLYETLYWKKETHHINSAPRRKEHGKCLVYDWEISLVTGFRML